MDNGGLKKHQRKHARKAALELTGAKAPKPKISDRHLQLERHGILQFSSAEKF